MTIGFVIVVHEEGADAWRFPEAGAGGCHGGGSGGNSWCCLDVAERVLVCEAMAVVVGVD